MCVAGEFSGAVCEVIAAGPTYTYQATGTKMPGWLVEFPRAMLWSDPAEFGWNKHEGWYPDAWLSPIRPAPELLPAPPVAVTA